MSKFKGMAHELNYNIEGENEDDILFRNAIMQGSSLKRVRRGQVVSGKVISIGEGGEVFVDVGAKTTGVIMPSDLGGEEVLYEGDIIDAYVMSVQDLTGEIRLSRRAVLSAGGMQVLRAAYEKGEKVKGFVIRTSASGLTVISNGTKVFIPISHAGIPYGTSLDSFLKTEISFNVLSVNDKGRIKGSIVVPDKKTAKKYEDDPSFSSSVSERIKASKEKAAAFIETAKEGEYVKGVVRAIKQFGVFVDLGGFDGMLPVSHISWGKTGDPEKAFKVGEEVSLLIKDINKEESRITLSNRRPEEDPWFVFINRYKKGDTARAVIISVRDFGAFARIEGTKIDALIHCSNISEPSITDARTVLKSGQEVEGRIIDIREKDRKVSFSLRSRRKKSDFKTDDTFSKTEVNDNKTPLSDAPIFPENKEDFTPSSDNV